MEKLKTEVEKKHKILEENLHKITDTIISPRIEKFITEVEKQQKVLAANINKITDTLISFEKPTDCTDIDVNHGSGIYTIYPKGFGSFRVYCDLEYNNTKRGWTVFQHRETGEEDFNRGWIDYEYGFGNLRNDFWLGNSKLNAITAQGRYEMMVLIDNFINIETFARYDFFKIGDKTSNYKLSIKGYSGTAAQNMSYTGNSLELNNNKAFTTKDNNNMHLDYNCAELQGGGWWFNGKFGCTSVNLNKKKFMERSADTVYGWIYWNVTLKYSTMMIRRIQ
ncbi:unnamed protein product [Mytilus coruscus]|uniref:Fibrinogen C-terminal domain-containing protein n=1 Tax=Mytilus coruscus TaxID=42192 RepID=A0A6J8B832_MYTCO|nr:unnamed protein product [Mytilus coruscus]